MDPLPEEREARSLVYQKLRVVRHLTRDVQRQAYMETGRGYLLAMKTLERIDGELAEIRILVSKLQEIRPVPEEPS